MHFSVTELLLIAFIVFMLFGSKRMRHMGGDLGTALRDFRKALNGESTPSTPPTPPETPPTSTRPAPEQDHKPDAKP